MGCSIYPIKNFFILSEGFHDGVSFTCKKNGKDGRDGKGEETLRGAFVVHFTRGSLQLTLAFTPMSHHDLTGNGEDETENQHIRP